jgi:multicomponent Na+:H+ antiporter subunit C
MILALALAVGILAACGAYLVLARDLLRVVLGIMLLSGAANLVLLAAGRLGPTQPAVVPRGLTVLEGAANPFPQALVLTALVIGFMLACFALILAVRLGQAAATDDVDALDAAEGSATAGGEAAP